MVPAQRLLRGGSCLLVVLAFLLVLVTRVEGGLQAWYSFDDNANYSTDGRVPAVQGNCPPRADIQPGDANSGGANPTLVAGRIGNGLRVGTVSTQRVELGTWSIGAINNQFTIAGWVLLMTKSSSRVIINKAASRENSGISWLVGFSSNNGGNNWRYRVALNNDPGQAIDRSPWWVGVQTNTWYHFALSWDGNTLYFSINGTVIDSQTATGKRFIEPAGVPNVIGNVSPTWDRVVDGIIDEIRIYDTYLDPAAVMDLATMTSNSPPPSISGPGTVTAQATLPTPITVSATTSNGNPPSFGWDLLSGPCPAVSFDNATSDTVLATFTKIEPFTLQVSVSDGQLCSSLNVPINVVGLAPAIDVSEVDSPTVVYNNVPTIIKTTIAGYPTPVLQWETPGIVTTPITVNGTVVGNVTGPGWVPIVGETSAEFTTEPGNPSIDGTVIRLTASNFMGSISTANITLVYNPNGPPSGDGDGSDNTGGIVAGVVVGTFVLCCLLLALAALLGLLYYLKKKTSGPSGRKKLVKPDFLPIIYEDFLGTPPRKKDADLKELKRLVVAEQMTLVESLLGCMNVVEAAKLPQALIFIFESYRNSSYSLLEHFIQKELELEKESTLFRASSMALKMFQPYSKMVAMDYLWNALAQIVNDINEMSAAKPADEEQGSSNMSLFRMSMELDPTKMDEASDPDINTLQLWLIVKKLFVSITRNHEQVPVEIRKVLTYVREEVAIKFPDAEYSSLGAFFFLRFISPSLIAPHMFGLLEGPPHPDAQRQLVLIAKVLQNLANGTLPGNKEEYMQKMNGFITDNQEPLHKFFDHLTEGAGPISNVAIPEDVETNCLIIVHDAILQYRSKLDSNLQQARGGDEVIAKLNEILSDKPISN